MTGNEEKAQQVIAHHVIHRGVEVLGAHAPDVFQLSQVGRRAAGAASSAQQVNGAVLADRHQPSARSVRNAFGGPLFEGGHESILRQLLCEADVPNQACQGGDDPRRLDVPDGVDGTRHALVGHGSEEEHLIGGSETPPRERAPNGGWELPGPPWGAG